MGCIMPLTVRPLAVMLCGLLPERWQTTHSAYILIIIEVIVVTLATVAATFFANEMSLVIDLIGGVLCVNISFVVPPVCYYAMFRSKLGAAKCVGLGLIVAFGVVLIVVCIATHLV